MTKKLTYLLWLTLVVVHTWLFFNHDSGLNALVFSLIMVPLTTWCHHLQKEKIWWLGAGGHLLSAGGVYLHGSWPAYPLYNLTSFLLAGLVFSVRSGLLAGFVNGIMASAFVGFINAVPVFLSDLTVFFSSGSLFKIFTKRKAYLYVAPASVTVVFYLLYSLANPDFFPTLKFPDFNFDFPLIFYVLFSGIMLSPLVFPWGLFKTETGRLDTVVRTRDSKGSEGMLGLRRENHQAVVMFSMLNMLIVAFLVFNILQIFFPSLNHAQGSHSDQVHQGFGTLIMSIVAAIGLIMFYFRANQNFYSGKTRLVQLAVIWIILNGMLALFTCYKNMLYVDACGLTYKRIWVFISILLTGAGLSLTIVKIKNLKTNRYLINQNAWLLYFVITSYTLVDWDRLITWYNTNYAQELDMEYIMALGVTKLPYLKTLSDQHDSRLVPYTKHIDEQINYMIPRAKGWQSETYDAVWLRSKLKK